MIYLDNNSTTMLLPSVATTIQECLAQNYANPASQHRAGQRARKRIAQARDALIEALGVGKTGHRSNRLIFTSGGTESNNLALRGLAGPAPARVLVSAIEHPSVLETAKWMSNQGYEVGFLPVDANGVVDVEIAAKEIQQNTRLVSVMLGNNETGVMQPIPQLAAICRGHGVRMHCDAVQAVGKIPVDFSALGVHALTFTAHKFHGPRGIGGLVVAHDTPIDPIMVGGTQQMGIRPGTECVALVSGMAEAMRCYCEMDSDRGNRLESLRDLFESKLTALIPEAHIHSKTALRLPHTSGISFPGLDRQALLLGLDRAGLACSTGSACVSGSSEPSHVLLAMQCAAELIQSGLRFSLSATTTPADIDSAVNMISTVVLSQKPL